MLQNDIKCIIMPFKALDLFQTVSKIAKKYDKGKHIIEK